MQTITNYGCSLTLLALLASCSNHQLYDAIQQNRQSACIDLPSPQYEECMENYSEPYDSYKEKRDEVIQSSS